MCGKLSVWLILYELCIFLHSYIHGTDGIAWLVWQCSWVLGCIRAAFASACIPRLCTPVPSRSVCMHGSTSHCLLILVCCCEIALSSCEIALLHYGSCVKSMDWWSVDLGTLLHAMLDIPAHHLSMLSVIASSHHYWPHAMLEIPAYHVSTTPLEDNKQVQRVPTHGICYVLLSAILKKE